MIEQYTEEIKKLPSTNPAREELVELIYVPAAVKTIDEFESLISRLESVTHAIRHIVKDMETNAEHRREVFSIARVVKAMVSDAVDSLSNTPWPMDGTPFEERLENPNPTSYLFVDTMILFTISDYETNIGLFRQNGDPMAVGGKTATDTYITAVALLLASYDYYKTPYVHKHKPVYDLIARFSINTHDIIDWRELSERIETLTKKFVKAVTFPVSYFDELRTPKYARPTDRVAGTEDVLEFLDRVGFPQWVYDHYSNKIEHILCPNHRSEIPEDHLMWITKTPDIGSLIRVPDKDSHVLYAVCRYQDGIYVLYIDPDTFVKDPEHYIISGMELLDENDPAPSPRRKLSLQIPATPKYRYVKDDI